MIKAKKYEICSAYKDSHCQDCHKFDIALIVLEDNCFFKEENILDVEWSFNKWVVPDRNLTIKDFPIASIEENKYQFYTNNHQ